MSSDTHQVVYNGEDCNLGRFGKVKKGDTLELTSLEFQYVESDKDFIKPAVATELPVVPFTQSEHYDLRSLPFKNEDQLRKKLTRTSSVVFWKIAEALADCGIAIPSPLDGLSKIEVIDIIVKEINARDWSEFIKAD